jgi:hypothetical protein
MKPGRIMLDGGRLNRCRIVSEGWVKEATSPQINVDCLFFYTSNVGLVVPSSVEQR